MEALKLLVTFLLISALFAAKTLKVSCGECSANMDCPTPFCYTFSGERDFMQKCVEKDQCRFKEPLTFDIYQCNYDIAADRCDPKICFRINNYSFKVEGEGPCENLLTSLDVKCGDCDPHCAAGTCFDRIFIDLVTGEKFDQGLCLHSSCLSTYGQVTIKNGQCTNGVDSVGNQGKCCESYTEAGPNVGLCLNYVAMFKDKFLKRTLERWLGLRERTFDCTVCNNEKVNDRRKILCAMNACP